MKPANEPWLDSGAHPFTYHRFVVMGGGTGLIPLLQGLRELCFTDGKALNEEDKDRLTGIVSVADDGGSSGILRRAYHTLAPGDIRNCLVALASDNSCMRKLFNFRFNDEIDRHNLGNLILTALSQTECDFTDAVDKAAELLDIQGRILPMTRDDVALRAEFCDGSSMIGEASITAAGKRIRELSLVPANINPLQKTLDAIKNADTIVLGPGSLYTSLMPNLLVPGIAAAIAGSRARVVLVMNLMTEPGETGYYDPADFIFALRRHAPKVRINYTIINNARIPPDVLRRYSDEGAQPISLENSRKQLDSYCIPVCGDLLASGEKVRHDPVKLANLFRDLSSPVSSPGHQHAIENNFMDVGLT